MWKFLIFFINESMIIFQNIKNVKNAHYYFLAPKVICLDKKKLIHLQQMLTLLPQKQ